MQIRWRGAGELRRDHQAAGDDNVINKQLAKGHLQAAGRGAGRGAGRQPAAAIERLADVAEPVVLARTGFWIRGRGRYSIGISNRDDLPIQLFWSTAAEVIFIYFTSACGPARLLVPRTEHKVYVTKYLHNNLPSCPCLSPPDHYERHGDHLEWVNPLLWAW